MEMSQNVEDSRSMQKQQVRQQQIIEHQ